MQNGPVRETTDDQETKRLLVVRGLHLARNTGSRGSKCVFAGAAAVRAAAVPTVNLRIALGSVVAILSAFCKR